MGQSEKPAAGTAGLSEQNPDTKEYSEGAAPAQTGAPASPATADDQAVPGASRAARTDGMAASGPAGASSGGTSADEKARACRDGLARKSKGRHPVGSGWPEIAASDPDDPARWWRQLEPGEPSVDWLPLTSIGAEMGVEHFVLDVNGKRGELSLATLTTHYGEDLPDTFAYRSGAGSRHYIMLIPAGVRVRSSASELAPGLNIRGEGNCAVLPPSITAEGRYVMIADAAPALPPRWLAQWLRRRAAGE